MSLTPKPDSKSAQVLSPKQVISEIAEVLKQVSISPEQKHNLAAIVRQIHKNPSVEIIMQTYTQLISILLEDLSHEKKMSALFLNKLNNSLNSVKTTVDNSIGDLSEQKKTTNQTSKVVMTNLKHFHKSVDSKNLDDLKDKVSSQLSALETSIHERDESEKKQISSLQEVMKGMRVELKKIEHDALSYKKQLEKQQQKILQDPLTHIPNRIALEERLNEEFKRVSTYEYPLWIATIDIDFFKKVNDSYGHTVGDKALRTIATVLQQSMRKNDFIARYGGEEFVLLLPNTPEKSTIQLLESIRKRVEITIIDSKKNHFNVTISIGAAYLLKNETVQQTFERSDSALYQAKENGRNQVVIKKK